MYDVLDLTKTGVNCFEVGTSNTRSVTLKEIQGSYTLSKVGFPVLYDKGEKSSKRRDVN